MHSEIVIEISLGKGLRIYTFVLIYGYKKIVYRATVNTSTMVIPRRLNFVLITFKLTLRKAENEKSCVSPPWFSGASYTGIQQNRSNKLNHQPVVASQTLLANKINVNTPYLPPLEVPLMAVPP